MKNTRDLLANALAPTEAVLKEEFETQFINRYEAMLTQLKADGMDANKSFAYPMSSRLSRMEYLAQKEAHDFCAKYTAESETYVSRSWNSPDPRVEKPTARAELKKFAANLAKQSLESYIAKLEAKIEKVIGVCDVEKITYVGGTNAWGWSHITVWLTKDIKYVWRTKMIVNVSCLGKLFNQWPTTLLA